MTRIEYFNTELAKNLGYEYDMELVGQMTDDEKCEVLNLYADDLDNVAQMIADYYAIC